MAMTSGHLATLAQPKILSQPERPRNFGSKSSKSKKSSLGNPKTVFSPGVVSFPWAFAESPNKIVNVTAHVLDDFKYDILLCRSFLEDTKTMTDHVSRFVKCIFRRQPMMSFNLLGETSHRLDGSLEGDIRIEGLPDLGSTHNIINEAWARAHGLPIHSGSQNCGKVYFPDGSSNLTTYEGCEDRHSMLRMRSVLLTENFCSNAGRLLIGLVTPY